MNWALLNCNKSLVNDQPTVFNKLFFSIRPSNDAFTFVSDGTKECSRGKKIISYRLTYCTSPDLLYAWHIVQFQILFITFLYFWKTDHDDVWELHVHIMQLHPHPPHPLVTGLFCRKIFHRQLDSYFGILYIARQIHEKQCWRNQQTFEITEYITFTINKRITTFNWPISFRYLRAVQGVQKTRKQSKRVYCFAYITLCDDQNAGNKYLILMSSERLNHFYYASL